MPLNRLAASRLPAVVALAAVALVLMLTGLDGTAFSGHGDGVDLALAARTMADSGDYQVADHLGPPWRVRPPLVPWGSAGLQQLTGRRDEWPPRLISVLGMLGLVMGTAHLGWRLQDLGTGLRAGLLMLTMPLVLGLARAPQADAVMLAGLGAALVAAAELAAGPQRFRVGWWLVLAVALLLLVLPWQLAMVARVPRLVAAWRSQGSDPLEPPSAWPYGPGLVATLPWLPLWLGGVVWGWRRRHHRRYRVLLTWAVGGLAFYTMASADRRSSDLLPMTPAIALLAAEFWRGSRQADPGAGFPRRLFLAARTLCELVVGTAAAALLAASVQGSLGWFWPLLLLVELVAGWRLDRRRHGFVPGLDTMVAMAAVALLAYHAEVVPAHHEFVSGRAFLTEARGEIGRAPDRPLVVSATHPGLAAWYLETADLEEVAPLDLPGRLERAPGSWLVTPPAVALDVPGLETVLERTWRSPFTRQTRSLGLYRHTPADPREDPHD